jgi:hypothetical protein
MDTVPGRPQLAGAPVAVHCADAEDAAIGNPITAASSTARNIERLILAPFQL